MREEPYMVSDGGPLIVIPGAAIGWWDGLRDYENSLMEGGSVETDYDVVCGAAPGSVVRIRDTDILVGGDGEMGGALIVMDGRLLLVQAPPDDADLQACMQHVLGGDPDTVVEMAIPDSTVRLVGGADDGGGETWGFRDARVSRTGLRRLRVFFHAGPELVVDFGPP